MNGPVFLAGASGSGKTLLRLALSSHPRLAISRRTYMWTRFYNRYGDLREPGNFERCLAAILAHKPTWALKPDPYRIRQEFWQGEPTYARLFALFHQHYAEQLGRPRWGDQLGFVEHYAGVIFDAYPDARMIHMIRDPRERYGASVTAERRRTGAVGAATAGWLHSVGLAKHNQQRNPDRYKVVRYEALVVQLEETLRDICAFLGEEFVPGMLTMEEALRFGDGNEEEPGGESTSRAAGSAPGGIPGRMASKREVAFIQARAGQDMVALGYELEPVQFSFWERFFFYGVDCPVNVAGMLAWRILLARQLA